MFFFVLFLSLSCCFSDLNLQQLCASIRTKKVGSKTSSDDDGTILIREAQSDQTAHRTLEEKEIIGLVKVTVLDMKTYRTT